MRTGAGAVAVVTLASATFGDQRGHYPATRFRALSPPALPATQHDTHGSMNRRSVLLRPGPDTENSRYEHPRRGHRLLHQSTKVLVCDAGIRAVIRSGSAPHPDAIEVGPAGWAAALETASAGGLLDDVAAIVVGCQQHRDARAGRCRRGRPVGAAVERHRVGRCGRRPGDGAGRPGVVGRGGRFGGCGRLARDLGSWALCRDGDLLAAGQARRRYGPDRPSRLRRRTARPRSA